MGIFKDVRPSNLASNWGTEAASLEMGEFSSPLHELSEENSNTVTPEDLIPPNSTGGEKSTIDLLTVEKASQFHATDAGP